MALETTMMDSIATIFRPSSTSRDANSGVVQNFTVLQESIVCSQQPAGISVQELYRQRNAFVSATFYFYEAPGAEVNDYLQVTDFFTGTTLTYLIQGNSFPVARGVLWGVDCQEVQDPVAPATVVSPTYSSVTSTTATLGGDVVSDGGAALTEVGVVWSITAVNDYPILGGSGVHSGTTGASPGVETFSLLATGLISDTNYSFAPYATTAVGTTYGNVETFDTRAV